MFVALTRLRACGGRRQRPLEIDGIDPFDDPCGEIGTVLDRIDVAT